MGVEALWRKVIENQSWGRLPLPTGADRGREVSPIPTVVLDDAPASHPASLLWRDLLGSSREGDRVDMLRQRHWGVQFQQSNVCTPHSRQLLTELGVADDSDHFPQLVVLIEPQLSGLDPKATSLQIFPGRQDNEPLREAGGQEN